MHRRIVPLILCLPLWACRCGEEPDDSQPPEGDSDADTDADGDTDADADADTAADTDCTVAVVETDPAAGVADWYWRDAPEVLFSEDAHALASLALLDAGGTPLDGAVTWDETGFLGTFEPAALLQGSAAYTLQVDVCGAQTLVPFETSPYGLPLDLAPEDLVHRTYVLDFETIVFTKPESFELILSMFGVHPLLIGIAGADAAELLLYVAEGKKQVDGDYKLLPDGRAWWFDPADFTKQPFFVAHQDELSLAYDEIQIPIADFHMEGTFAPDGSAIGGLLVSGIADTRYISQDLAGDDVYVCDLMADWGIDCVACGDGEELCIEILAEGVEAPLEDGLDIIPADDTGA